MQEKQLPRERRHLQRVPCEQSAGDRSEHICEGTARKLGERTLQEEEGEYYTVFSQDRQ